MEKQMQNALDAMTAWLADEHELGKRPSKIECAGEFDLHNLHYYMFKYKKSLLGGWLLGVCGGYEPGDEEHCGHVFSEMQAYDPNTAVEESIKMVEMLRQYWMQRAQEEEQKQQGDAAERKGGTFVGHVLLKDPVCDLERVLAQLKEEWGIEPEPDENGEVLTQKDDSLVFTAQGCMVAVSLMPAPVPGGEAERNAASNYFWKEAVEVTKTHTAHLLVAVLARESDYAGAAKLFVKTACTCLKEPNALGIYVSGTVLQPEFYLQVAEDLQEDELPILGLVYLGVYRNESGNNGYTIGLEAFGLDELEILGSRQEMSKVHEMLFAVCGYVLNENVVLQDGETIGFTEDQKLKITRSEAVAIKGTSLKIAF